MANCELDAVEVCVRSAAAAQAAGQRLYDNRKANKTKPFGANTADTMEKEAMEAMEAMEAKAEMQAALVRAHAEVRSLPGAPRWEQLYAAAQRQQERVQHRRFLQEMEEEQWLKDHSLHQGNLHEDAYARLYEDAKQRSQRLYAKEQAQLAAEARQLSGACVHNTYSGSLGSEIATQRARCLYEDAQQRRERLAAKRELQNDTVQRAAAAPNSSRVGSCNMAASSIPNRVITTSPPAMAVGLLRQSEERPNPVVMSELLMSRTTSWRPTSS